MPREVNQVGRAPQQEGAWAAVGAGSLSGDLTAKSLGLASSRALWFGAKGPADEVAPPPPPSPIAALPIIAAAVMLLAWIDSPVPRAVVPLALSFVALVVIYRARPKPAVVTARAARGVELDGASLVFRSERGEERLLDLDQPFGVTVLATPRRERLVVLLSSPSASTTLGARFDAVARRAFSPLLERATTVATDDAGLEAVGPDGEPLLFSPEDLGALLDALVARSPACLDRVVSTDARGAAVTLDGRQLSVGERSIDLTAPLEWRSIVFQEAFGQAVAVYQGTWVRQAGAELVLVCLLPSLGPIGGGDLDLGTLDRSAVRDLRLMQASPEEPPPTEQRVAIDRLMMLPLRSALDRAPRPSQHPPPPSRARA